MASFYPTDGGRYNVSFSSDILVLDFIRSSGRAGPPVQPCNINIYTVPTSAKSQCPGQVAMCFPRSTGRTIGCLSSILNFPPLQLMYKAHPVMNDVAFGQQAS